METKKGKYDTNPLDPDYVRETEEVWGDGGGRAETQEVKGATRQVNPPGNDGARANVYSEAPTRRYDNPPLDAPYPSVFVPPTYAPPASTYQPPTQPYKSPVQHTPQRTVLGIGLSEKWAVMLPYAPFYIGVVVSLIELFLVPRKEGKVRFHAAQGLSLHIAIMVIQTVSGGVRYTGSLRLPTPPSGLMGILNHGNRPRFQPPFLASTLLLLQWNSETLTLRAC